MFTVIYDSYTDYADSLEPYEALQLDQHCNQWVLAFLLNQHQMFSNLFLDDSAVIPVRKPSSVDFKKQLWEISL